MEKNKSLFREEAIHNCFERNLGPACINIPLNYQLVSIFAAIVLIVLVLFLLFGEISEKIRVRGYLDADKGIVTVHSLQNGTVLQSAVKEGQTVNKGDILFILKNKEQENTKVLIGNFKQRIKNFKQEYQLKEDQHQSMSILYKKHFVSASSIKTIEAELLEIKNKIKTLELEKIKYKQSTYQCIRSPSKGVVTNILYHPNQVVGAAKTLLQIIPDDSRLIARLCVPVQDSGFLKKNRRVVIQYDAYPSQRFGVHSAFIKEINLSILRDGQEEKPIKIGEPYYKLEAQLEKSYITLNGERRELNYGMTFTGIISGEKKKMWQWIFFPLDSYFGVFS